MNIVKRATISHDVTVFEDEVRALLTVAAKRGIGLVEGAGLKLVSAVVTLNPDGSATASLVHEQSDAPATDAEKLDEQSGEAQEQPRAEQETLAAPIVPLIPLAPLGTTA